MYETPRLARYGSFAELTRAGGSGFGDTTYILDDEGNVVGSGTDSDNDPDQDGCVGGDYGNVVTRCSL